tara:strand:- start:3 stop:581 length:579 start_codon:yes stop_codon:yes gene_type:complete
MKKRIGLLGGSFDPPHYGHLKISFEAIKTLKLFEVWWVIALQNPLKEPNSSTNYNERFNNSNLFTASYKNIKISNIEKQYSINFSIDSITKLKNNFNNIDFIWLMGADNFAQFHNWKQWHQIMGKIPIVVFNRPGFSYKALTSKAAYYYKNYRVKAHTKPINTCSTPKWMFLWHINENISSTKIRKLTNENK